MNLEIIYLDHSGFAVKSRQHVLIFDYYRDPADSLTKLMKDSKSVWVFSSHRHADHFNPQISQWQKNVSAYFLSEDIREMGGLSGVEEDKIVYLRSYEKRAKGPLRVVSYGSTDEGVSFAVEVEGWRLFHAGDLNWWHWKGDTQDNQQLAEEWFMKEMNLLAGLEFDVAFFPVDSRLEEYRDIGVKEFCRRVEMRQLIAMHTCGQGWIPPIDFSGNKKDIEVWCPVCSGERLSLKFSNL